VHNHGARVGHTGNETIGTVSAIRGAGLYLCTPEPVSTAQAVGLALAKSIMSLLEEGWAECSVDLAIAHVDDRVEH
jgi:hypothetical protein